MRWVELADRTCAEAALHPRRRFEDHVRPRSAPLVRTFSPPPATWNSPAGSRSSCLRKLIFDAPCRPSRASSGGSGFERAPRVAAARVRSGCTHAPSRNIGPSHPSTSGTGRARDISENHTIFVTSHTICSRSVCNNASGHFRLSDRHPRIARQPMRLQGPNTTYICAAVSAAAPRGGAIDGSRDGSPPGRHILSDPSRRPGEHHTGQCARARAGAASAAAVRAGEASTWRNGCWNRFEIVLRSTGHANASCAVAWRTRP